MRSKVKIESCCGSEAYVIVLETPILKEHAPLFEDKGFIILKNFFKSGILQATKKGLTITGGLGQTKFNVRCSGKNCTTLWPEFFAIIKEIEDAKSK